ncbi:hypothetical protein CRYUN_Cryun02cG0095300 [Craigia yunnanensis]
MASRKKIVLFCGGIEEEEEEKCGSCKEEEGDRLHSLSKEGSQSSISVSVLPSLGPTRSNRKVKLRCFILSPFDPRYRSWDTFLVFLVLYTAWVSPFEFGFLTKPEYPLSISDNVVNALFGIDIVLTFFVAYLDKTSYLLVDEPKKIAWRYVRTWFLFYFISIIPAEVDRVILPHFLPSYDLLSFLRLWHLRRVSQFFSRLEKDKGYSYFSVQCLKLLCVTIWPLIIIIQKGYGCNFIPRTGSNYRYWTGDDI